VEVYDPYANHTDVAKEYCIELIKEPKSEYDSIVHVVSHDRFKTIDLKKISKKNVVIYDVKGSLDITNITSRL